MSKKRIPEQIPDNLRVFISHKSDDFSTSEARKLRNRLASDHITGFLDVVNLNLGNEWDDEIYEALRTSDVLIVLLNDQESNWVEREVYMARALNISIFPICIVDEDVDISGVISRLDLEKIQRISYCSLEEEEKRFYKKHPVSSKDTDTLKAKLPETVEDGYQEILSSIIRLSKVTRDRQRTWAKSLRQSRKRQKFSPSNRSQVVFKVKDTPYEIHIATGDIIELKNMDVIVNSENNYMQMARRLDNNTLSSALRYHGSKFDRKNLMADTVQDELNQVIYSIKDARPVQIGSIFVTSGGHKDSKLAKNTKLRHIIHAATTRIDIGTSDIYEFVPMSRSDIPEVTKDCLEEFDNLNQLEKNLNKPLTNIFFPVFNAGEVERSIDQVLTPMLEGIFAYINDQPETHLKHIHILAYTQNELNIIDAILSNHKMLSRQV
jgi:O-acetyl-ADP-ribose deacetylase (regulator of RNase III)